MKSVVWAVNIYFLLFGVQVKEQDSRCLMVLDVMSVEKFTLSSYVSFDLNWFLQGAILVLYRYHDSVMGFQSCS